ncbi:MAG: type IV pilus modification protein PilV [Halomonas sp.]|nr:type IV pilus modification protein PilV [Halomonas sp.]
MVSRLSLCSRAARGFTLIEALVALLVLSLGLLGVAAMQIKTMQSTHLSYQRSLATLIASDANERLWVALGDEKGICPSVASVETDWLAQWQAALPGMENNSAIVKQDNCDYLITVSWDEERFAGEENASTLTYFSSIPGEPSP